MSESRRVPLIPPNPSGLCFCGCGGLTPLARTSDRTRGLVAGEHRRYIFGHSRREYVAGDNITHGQTCGGKRTPEYRAYAEARERCRDLTNPHYGGRGIEFRFESFEDFYAELGARPEDKDAKGRAKYSLDRINNDGHYEAGNVRWATKRQQNLNRRPIVCGSHL